MRILHLDDGKEMRGGQWQVLRLHRELVRRGVDSLLLARESAPLLTLAAAEGLPCDMLRPLRVPLLSRRYDLLHAHDAKSHSYAALCSRVPFVVSRRVAFPVQTGATSKWKYSKPALYLAVSKFVAERLLEAGVPANRIEVVYDGVPVPETAANGTAVLVPHSLDSEKGMSLALEAAVLAEVPIKVTRDLEADLLGAQALLYLTNSEGLGSGVLLGMAAGVSVIASNVGGIPELLTDGVNGLLVENELQAVANAFRRIAPGMGAAARACVIERFTVERMVDDTLACYRRVVG